MSHRFDDVPDDHVFHDDISWLADKGITKGTNPPANTEFTPEEPVTRGQMAAFLRRFANSLEAPEPEPPPVVDEPYPANAVEWDGQGSLRDFVQNNPVTEIPDGLYTGQQLGEGLGGAYVFSRTGQAVFDGGHQIQGFQWESSGITLRNFQVRRYVPTDDHAIIVARGAQDCNYLDMQVGLVKGGAAFRINDGSRWQGGKVHDCQQFAYGAVSGTGWFIGGWGSDRPLIIESCGNDVDPDPEIGKWQTPSGTSRTSYGAGKAVFSSKGTVEDVVVRRCNQGIWFDIANEAATIRRIHGDRVARAVVFLEASYGQVDGMRWTVEDVTADNSATYRTGNEGFDYPVPAVVTVTMTPDVDIRRVSGDGNEYATVGFVEKNHPQLTKQDASRMGIDDSTVSDSILRGGGFGGSTSNGQVRRGDPTFTNNTYRPGRYWWKGQEYDASGFKAVVGD